MNDPTELKTLLNQQDGRPSDGQGEVKPHRTLCDDSKKEPGSIPFYCNKRFFSLKHCSTNDLIARLRCTLVFKQPADKNHRVRGGIGLKY